MAVIARWECPRHGDVGATAPGRCGRLSCLRALAVVEYVPRDEHQVLLCERHAEEWVPDPSDPVCIFCESETCEGALHTYVHIAGGQYETTSAAPPSSQLSGEAR